MYARAVAILAREKALLQTWAGTEAKGRAGGDRGLRVEEGRLVVDAQGRQGVTLLRDGGRYVVVGQYTDAGDGRAGR